MDRRSQITAARTTWGRNTGYEKTFSKLEGFGSHGFPENAISFARIAYASSYVKCHFPHVFYAVLLNSQPMGFYAPAQIVGDARNHGVEILPICINRSRWDCTLERIGNTDCYAVTLVLRMVKVLAVEYAEGEGAKLRVRCQH